MKAVAAPATSFTCAAWPSSFERGVRSFWAMLKMPASAPVRSMRSFPSFWRQQHQIDERAAHLHRSCAIVRIGKRLLQRGHLLAARPGRLAGQQEGQSTPRRPWASTAGSGAPIWDELPLDQREEDGGSLTFALVALLGIPHVERNGHHYFFGLDHLTMEEREAALAHHQDLYRPFGRSAVLRIEDGALVLRSLQVPGIGFKPTPDMDAMQPPDAWLAAHGRDADLGS